MVNNKCHCFIHHPETVEERQEVFNLLEYSRKIKDKQGVTMTLAQLQPCPSSWDWGAEPPKPEKTVAVMRKELTEFSSDMARDDKDHCVSLLVWSIQELCKRLDWDKPPHDIDQSPDKLAAFWIKTMTDDEIKIEWEQTLGEEAGS